IMEKTFLAGVPWYPPLLVAQTKSTLSFLPFMKKKDAAEEAKRKEASLADIDRDISQLDQRVERTVEGLFSIGLEAVVLNDEQLVELFYNFYNPGTVERQEVSAPK
ncbi:MAG: hypothetical protein AAB495_00685, partial [Patescibacteria group bacterium]